MAFNFLRTDGTAKTGGALRYLFIAVGLICLVITLLIASVHHRYHWTPLSSDACGVARFRLNQASDFSNAYRYRDAYDASMLGLEADETCRDGRAKIVNQGFLLSTKAMAEHFLSRGDFSTDLNHAINVLERCRAMAPKLDRTVAGLCEKQEQSDIETDRRLRTRQIFIP